MTARASLTAMCLLCLVACGGEYVDIPTPKPQDGPPVDSAYVGVWVGTSTTTMEGLPPAVFDVSVETVASGPVLSILGICPDGTGDVEGTWDDMRGHIRLGRVSCRAPQGDCADAKLWFDTGSVVQGDGLLRVALHGEYVGCGDYRRPVTTEFIGRR